MSLDPDKLYSKNESSLTKTLNQRIKNLQDQLSEKEAVIEQYEEQFKKLYEDFNYNVDVIYERDKEIEVLNQKLEEFSSIIASKDLEIQDLQKNSAKIKQIEYENAMLKKKIESLQSERSERRLTPRTDVRTPRLEYKSLLKDNTNVLEKKQNYSSGNVLGKKNSNSILNEPTEKTSDQFIEMSFDLESRIKALEIENNHKDRKSTSLSNSKIFDQSNEIDSDISGAQEKVKKQEKEISELIKSLQVYKKQSETNSKNKLKTYDEQISALNQDIERLRTGDIRSSSRGSMSEDIEKKSYHPVVRPRSSLNKKIN